MTHKEEYGILNFAIIVQFQSLIYMYTKLLENPECKQDYKWFINNRQLPKIKALVDPLFKKAIELDSPEIDMKDLIQKKGLGLYEIAIYLTMLDESKLDEYLGDTYELIKHYQNNKENQTD